MFAKRRNIMPVIKFMKKNAVFCIAAFAAIVTCFFVPPDKDYFGYFDWTTLACLFLTLAVICAYRNIKFFTIISRKLVLLAGNLRSLFFMLVIITFIGSMIIANDMALITFLPLGYFSVSVAKQEKYIPYLFILQNISANLGGMLTPFGNPQNLYLYSYFKIPTVEFCSIMLKPFILAVTLLSICCLFVKPIKLEIGEKFPEKLNMKRTLLYSVLFIFSILIVFRVIPFWIGLIIVPAILFVSDRESLLMVDYALLGTFFFFFIFAGNLSRIEAVNSVLSSLLDKDTLTVSVLSCQFISNVPSAILLSQFTENYHELLVGVNIGGVGTLIASLASLITFREYTLREPYRAAHYMKVFTLLNLLFLVILTLVALVF